MIDLVKLKLIAGDGGHGKVAFHREKFVTKGGPSGGYGGNGGNVIFRGTDEFNTLRQFAGVKKFKAEDGQHGGKKKKSGKKGQDIVIGLPLGTEIWLLSENEVSEHRRKIYTLDHKMPRTEMQIKEYEVFKETQHIPPREKPQWVHYNSKDKSNRNKGVFLDRIDEIGQEIVICQGGYGGRGNIAFKSSRNTTPMQAEYGTFGEAKQVILELKLLADVGLVGFPNAGKSTFLSKVTKARPKIANYPFTTLEPHLGVLKVQKKGMKQELVIADIPGLIEGASEGKGLGHEFLRHIENCKSLVFMLYLTESQVFDENLSNQQKAEIVWNQFQSLHQELEEYHSILTYKPFCIALNKIDIYPQELSQTIQEYFKLKKHKLLLFSNSTGQGLDKLKMEIIKLYNQEV